MFTPFQFGKYYLTERLAVGGMAELFKAKLYGVSGFEKQMVVKQILPKYSRNDEFIKMFIDEAKIAVNLHHGNIVPIYELGRIDGIYFIAMEFVDGRDLAEILERARAAQQPLSVEHAVFIAIEICKGLDHAHRQTDAAGAGLGVIHRDISPPNIMISMQGEVKITDFGIAKAAHKLGRTEAGVVKGTFGYMSPEQVRGLPVDQRTDLFSAGVLLWEMLTGRRLFVGESEMEAIERVKEARIPPPSGVNAKVPQALNPIVLKALAKESDDRYPDANELQLALSRFLYAAGTAASASTLSRYVLQLFERPLTDVFLEEPTARSRPNLSILGAAKIPSEVSRQVQIDSSPQAAPAGPKKPMDVGVGKALKINATLALPSLSVEKPELEPLDKLVIEADDDKGHEELEEEKTGVYYGVPGPKRPEVPELRFPPKEERVPKRRGASELSDVLEAELPPCAEPPRSGVTSAATSQGPALAEAEGADAPFAESETPVVSVSEVGEYETPEGFEQATTPVPDLMTLLAKPAADAEAPSPARSRPSTGAGAPQPSGPTLAIEESPSSPQAGRTRKPSGVFSNTMRMFVAGLDGTQSQEAVHQEGEPSALQAAIDMDELEREPRSIHPTVLGWTLIVLLVLGAGGLVLYKKTAIFGARRSEDSSLLRPEDIKKQQVAPVAKKGTILLRSEPPGASFFRFVGETPLTVDQLDPGQSHLFLVEREGYALVYQQVSGAELEQENPRVQVQLNPVGPGSYADPPALAQAGSPTGQRRALTIQTQPPMAMVWQLVGSGAQVSLTDVDLSKSVDIKAMLPGHRPGISHISAVDFPGDSTRFSTVIRLDPDRRGADAADGGELEKDGSGSGADARVADPAAASAVKPTPRPRPRRRRPRPRRPPKPKPKLQTPSWAR